MRAAHAAAKNRGYRKSRPTKNKQVRQKRPQSAPRTTLRHPLPSRAPSGGIPSSRPLAVGGDDFVLVHRPEQASVPFPKNPSPGIVPDIGAFGAAPSGSTSDFWASSAVPRSHISSPPSRQAHRLAEKRRRRLQREQRDAKPASDRQDQRHPQHKQRIRGGGGGGGGGGNGSGPAGGSSRRHVGFSAKKLGSRHVPRTGTAFVAGRADVLLQPKARRQQRPVPSYLLPATPVAATRSPVRTIRRSASASASASATTHTSGDDDDGSSGGGGGGGGSVLSRYRRAQDGSAGVGVFRYSHGVHTGGGGGAPLPPQGIDFGGRGVVTVNDDRASQGQPFRSEVVALEVTLSEALRRVIGGSREEEEGGGRGPATALAAEGIAERFAIHRDLFETIIHKDRAFGHLLRKVKVAYEQQLARAYASSGAGAAAHGGSTGSGRGGSGSRNGDDFPMSFHVVGAAPAVGGSGGAGSGVDGGGGGGMGEFVGAAPAGGGGGMTNDSASISTKLARRVAVLEHELARARGECAAEATEVAQLKQALATANEEMEALLSRALASNPSIQRQRLLAAEHQQRAQRNNPPSAAKAAASAATPLIASVLGSASGAGGGGTLVAGGGESLTAEQWSLRVAREKAGREAAEERVAQLTAAVLTLQQEVDFLRGLVRQQQQQPPLGEAGSNGGGSPQLVHSHTFEAISDLGASMLPLPNASADIPTDAMAEPLLPPRPANVPQLLLGSLSGQEEQTAVSQAAEHALL